MPCYGPLHGWRSNGGQLTFDRREAISLTPMTVSCGQCTGCRLERSLQWAIRIMHEARSHERSCFLTLTYDNDHFPRAYTKTSKVGGKVVYKNYRSGSINVAHFQGFMKRLRRNEQRAASKQGREAISYRFFHCGEYGEQTGRPHYHAAFFGADFKEGASPWQIKRGHPTWTNTRLNDAWGLGRVVVGSLTTESAQYVARYILKKVNGPTAAQHYEGKHPEYVTMSRRPGLGQAWYDEFKNDVYPRDEVVHEKHLRRPPRYYDYLLQQEEPELLEELKLIRRREGEKFANTQEQLDRREEAVKQQLKRNQREPTHLSKTYQ